MATPTRKTRSDKGVPRTSTIDTWIGIFIQQSSEARRVWIGVMTALDQQLNDGVIVPGKRPETDDAPDDEAERGDAVAT